VARHLGSAAAGVRLPAGTYAELLLDECEGHSRPDPRLWPIEGSVEEYEEFEELKRQGAAKAAAMCEEKLAAGEPLVVSASQIGGHNIPGAPEWLTTPAIYGGASAVRVYRDDVVEPAEFYGDTTGQVWERVPVPAQHRPR
jgi:hypothetical protein